MVFIAASRTMAMIKDFLEGQPEKIFAKRFWGRLGIATNQADVAVRMLTVATTLSDLFEVESLPAAAWRRRGFGFLEKTVTLPTFDRPVRSNVALFFQKAMNGKTAP